MRRLVSQRFSPLLLIALLLMPLAPMACADDAPLEAGSGNEHCGDSVSHAGELPEPQDPLPCACATACHSGAGTVTLTGPATQWMAGAGALSFPTRHALPSGFSTPPQRPPATT